MDRLTGYIQQGQPQTVVAEEAVGQVGGPPLAEAITPIAEAVTPVGTVIPTQAGEAPSAAPGYTDPSGAPLPADPGPTIPDYRDEEIRQLQAQQSAQATEL